FFFFKQKTAYEMLRSLVGSEMCIRDSVYIALENNLEIIPVINKIDLPNADVEKVKHEIEHIIGIDCKDAICVSAKTGVGIK
ncbi:GTP-binding protein, partial [Campylobacter coli]|uniref:GTP-binding protein n=1 Tax=Campylobacter coli TaxID=195 RepID=UPI0039817444